MVDYSEAVSSNNKCFDRLKCKLVFQGPIKTCFSTLGG